MSTNETKTPETATENPAEKVDSHPHSLQFDAYQKGLENYSEGERDRVEWLWGYFNGVLAKNKEVLSKELGFPWEDVRPAFSGRVTAAIREDLWESIDALRRRLLKQKPLVRTIVTDRILQALDYCRDDSAMIYIAGPTGRGKTYTAEYWAAQNNHGRTIMIRVPSGCSRGALVTMLCRKVGVSASGKCADREENLRKALGPRNVLIADEAGHLLSGSGRPGGAIELFRDLHDMCKCGVALIITDVYLAEIKQGRNADYFEQFLGRLEFPVEIPKNVRRDEVRQVLQAYFERPDEDLVTYALKLAGNRDGRLRTLYKDLARAEEFARSKSRKITKSDLQMFVKWRLSGGAWPDDN